MSISLLNLAVGKIVQVEKHPDADSLYVEKIDLGDPEGPVTVVSGLVKFISPDDMISKNVVLVRNLKPAKMRGILSNAMILCASNIDHTIVEFIEPPTGSEPGDKVYCKDHDEGEPSKVLKGSKFTEIQENLTTNDDLTVIWKDVPLQTKLGFVKCKTLKNAKIA